MEDIITEIDASNYSEFIKRDFACLNFFTDWHMNCLMTLPIMEQLAGDFQKEICFGKLNIEESEELAEKHNVSNLPTVILFNKGKPIERITGNFHEDFLREKLSNLIN